MVVLETGMVVSNGVIFGQSIADEPGRGKIDVEVHPVWLGKAVRFASASNSMNNPLTSRGRAVIVLTCFSAMISP